jgi:Fe-S cluster biogenesis protein NfuA/nitrite reductase/ring-hydroxylating ferredoxin subunit
VDGKNVRAIGERIEALVRDLERISDPRDRERAEELVRLLLEFYGAGLARLMDIVMERDGSRLGDRLANDPLVASLLLLHNLHPVDTETRVVRALDQVRPYLASHGGDVTLLGVDDGVVRLRLEGSCNGCGSSTVTMKLAIERAIEEAAPEVRHLEVEGVSPPPSPLIQIEVPPRRPATSRAVPLAGDWLAVEDRPDLSPGAVAGLELRGQKVIVCCVGDALFAYRDTCSSCGSPLQGGTLLDQVLACPSCRRNYDVRLAGRCLEAEAPALHPLPLLRENGGIRIAVPAAP